MSTKNENGIRTVSYWYVNLLLILFALLIPANWVYWTYQKDVSKSGTLSRAITTTSSGFITETQTNKGIYYSLPLTFSIKDPSLLSFDNVFLCVKKVSASPVGFVTAYIKNNDQYYLLSEWLQSSNLVGTDHELKGLTENELRAKYTVLDLTAPKTETSILFKNRIDIDFALINLKDGSSWLEPYNQVLAYSTYISRPEVSEDITTYDQDLPIAYTLLSRYGDFLRNHFTFEGVKRAFNKN